MTQTYFEKPGSPQELAHYGVLGMKWGVRKRRDSKPSSSGKSSDSSSKKSSAPKKTKPKKVSRKEHRAKVKAERNKFYEQKAESIMKEALKDPEVLIKLSTPGDPYGMVVTGQQFANYASNGGLFDVKTSDIYARRDGDAYVRTQNRTYKKPKR